MTTLYVDNIAPNLQSRVSVPGHVIQVVQEVQTTQSVTTSAAWSATNITASITPTSTSSKIYCSITGGMNGFAGGTGVVQGFFKIYRDIGGGGFSSLESTTRGKMTIYGPGSEYMPLSLSALDTPSTTSACTYTLYFNNYSASLNLSTCRDSNGEVQITLMEIAG